MVHGVHPSDPQGRACVFQITPRNLSLGMGPVCRAGQDGGRTEKRACAPPSVLPLPHLLRQLPHPALPAAFPPATLSWTLMFSVLQLWGDCTPMFHVPLLKCPLLCAMPGCGRGSGPGSSGSCLLLAFSASLVSEGGSSVFWKVSSFSPPPFCQLSPYLPGPLWGSPDAYWEWGSWLIKDQERRFTAW